MSFAIGLLFLSALLGLGTFHLIRPYLLLVYPLNRKAFLSLKKRSWTLQSGFWWTKLNEDEWIEVRPGGAFHKSKTNPSQDVQLLPPCLAKYLERKIVDMKKKEASSQRQLTIERLDKPIPGEGWLSEPDECKSTLKVP